MDEAIVQPWLVNWRIQAPIYPVRTTCFDIFTFLDLKVNDNFCVIMSSLVGGRRKNIKLWREKKNLPDHMANENHDFAVQDDYQVLQKTLPRNEPANAKTN